MAELSQADETNDRSGTEVENGENTEVAEGAAEAAGTEEQAGEETVEGDQESSGDAANSMDELPSWARQEIKNLRREAANYRTQLKQVQDAQVTSEEEFNTLREELSAKEIELVRARAAKNLPDELVPFLKGTTEEEIKSEVETLSRLIAPAPATFKDSKPGGGLNAGASGASTPSAKELAELARKQRY